MKKQIQDSATVCLSDIEYLGNFIPHAGYPEKPGYPHYGLYQPLLDKFLLVTNDKHQSIQVKNLLISRYPLFIFQLDTAKNYTFNIVDNNNCENWSVIPTDKFDFSKIYHSYPIDAAKLIPTVTKHNYGLDISKEKLWIQYVWYWIRFFEFFINATDHWHYQKNTIHSMNLCNFDEYNDKTILMNQHIAQIQLLLLSGNIKLTHNKILQYINADSKLNRYYLQWLAEFNE